MLPSVPVCPGAMALTRILRRPIARPRCGPRRRELARLALVTRIAEKYVEASFGLLGITGSADSGISARTGIEAPYASRNGIAP